MPKHLQALPIALLLAGLAGVAVGQGPAPGFFTVEGRVVDPMVPTPEGVPCCDVVVTAESDDPVGMTTGAGRTLADGSFSIEVRVPLRRQSPRRSPSSSMPPVAAVRPPATSSAARTP